MTIAIRKQLFQIFLLSTIGLFNVAIAGGVIEAIDTSSGNDEISDSITHGEEAHKNHCYKCHTDSVYTRDNRFVKSIDALSKQVVRCKEGSDIPWFDEDADAVVQFLNKEYYRF